MIHCIFLWAFIFINENIILQKYIFCFTQIIAADGEKQAARSLKEAAVVMNENKSALQLRYLQTLGHIATENHSTIYFPLPLDSIGGSKMK